MYAAVLVKWGTECARRKCNMARRRWMMARRYARTDLVDMAADIKRSQNELTRLISRSEKGLKMRMMGTK